MPLGKWEGSVANAVWEWLGNHYLAVSVTALGVVVLTVIAQIGRQINDRFPALIGGRSTPVLLGSFALLVAVSAITARALAPDARIKDESGGVAMPGVITATGRSTGWGPERTTYTMAEPASSPTLNSITDSPYGDERNFVRVRNVRETAFGDDAEACPGDLIEVHVYVANDVSSHLGDEGTLRGLSLRMTATAQNEETYVTAYLDANNASEVWDSGRITCAGRPVKLRFLEGASRMRTNDKPDGYQVQGDPFGRSIPIGKAKQDGLFSEGAHVDGHSGWAAFLLLQLEVL